MTEQYSFNIVIQVKKKRPEGRESMTISLFTERRWRIFSVKKKKRIPPRGSYVDKARLLFILVIHSKGRLWITKYCRRDLELEELLSEGTFDCEDIGQEKNLFQSLTKKQRKTISSLHTINPSKQRWNLGDLFRVKWLFMNYAMSHGNSIHIFCFACQTVKSQGYRLQKLQNNEKIWVKRAHQTFCL